MLHAALLPFHGRWAEFLQRLRFVVIDELHVLRGIFGSHAGHLLRRLRRLCARYGSSPTFIFTSATIGEPGRLATELCGLPVVAVTDDGSPRGERLFALWNPPLLDEATGTRASGNVEVAKLTAALVEGGWRTVTFCRSRRGTELVAGEVRRRVPDELAATVRSYRAGYLAAERREIEADLFAGRVQGIVATSALELGVDIGGLDACVLNGFPGTIASMWQQAGRAGRGEGASLAVLVAGTDQLDQWLMTHPREVFRRAPEPAVVNLANPSVLLPQLACAAYEQPLSPDDDSVVGRRPGRRRPPAGARRSGAPPRRPGLLERTGLAGTGARPALGLTGGVPHRRARRPARGHGRRQPGLRAGPPGRDLPPPRSAVPRGAARSRRPRGPRRAGRGRRVHPGPQRHVGDDPRDRGVVGGRPVRRRAGRGRDRHAGHGLRAARHPVPRGARTARSSTSRRPAW